MPPQFFLEISMALKLEPISRTAARKLRKPEHKFLVSHSPMAIQPFMIAPVLPGETLKSLLVQARVVTDPVKHPLLGWWQEYYFFYVKHRDLDQRDVFTQMMLEPQADMSSVQSSTADAGQFYGGRSGIPWLDYSLARIVEVYFRDDNEDLGAKVDGYWQAKVEAPGWMDDLMAGAPEIDDVNVDLNADSNITASEVERAMRHYEFMRMNNLTEMTYEDFIRAYGVRAADIELHRPELIRFVRLWSYPSNTIDASTGTPSSAVSWSVQERADKDRFFKEPGFVVGVTVTRPKVYFGGQDTYVAAHMQTAFDWLPPQLTNDLAVSLKTFAGGAGPLVSANQYTLDIRDLLMYGDQFFNDGSAVRSVLPVVSASAVNKKYLAAADIRKFFVDDADPGVKNKVRQDGIVMLNILSPQRDQT